MALPLSRSSSLAKYEVLPLNSYPATNAPLVRTMTLSR